jgi:TonB family protein
MNAYALSLELSEIQARTRKIVFVSLGVHALLFLLLALRHTIAPPPPALTEISWIDPVTIQPPVPTATVKPLIRAERLARPSPQQIPQHFVRRTTERDFTPRPQNRNAMEDLLERKSATMQRSTVMQASIADVAAPSALTRPSLASVPNDGASAKEAVSLTRREGPASSPITLARSEPRRTRPAELSSIPERTVAAAKIEKTDSSARRIIDGATLVGPVADRMLVSYRKPVYPEWAKSEGVEATLTLYFIVLPNGTVKENILIEKTSGFGDFDRNAIDALVAWIFEPLPRGETGEQWGSITFNYRLAG